MEYISYSPVFDRHLINGPHNPMFWRYKNIVEKFVKEMKLEPIHEEMIQKRSLELNPLHMDPPWWKYGGMKLAHVHLNGHTYLLKDEQWREFSKILLVNIQNKLKDAKGVSFENAQDIVNSMESVF